MSVLLISAVVLVAALTIARRLARHPAFVLLKDIGVSVFLLVRLAWRLARMVARFVGGEVRSWRLSRS